MEHRDNMGATPVELELEQINDELVSVQETLRRLARERSLLQDDRRGRAALRRIEADLSRARATREALQERRLQLQRASGTGEQVVESIAARRMGAEGRLEPRGRPHSRGRKPADAALARPTATDRLYTATRFLLSVVLVAAVTVVIGGGAYYVATARLGATPSTPTTPDSIVAPGTDQPVSLTERLIGLYLSLNRDRLETPPGDDPTPVLFVVEPGESAAAIATRLEEAGLITDARLFRLLLRYRGSDQALEAGTFQLNRTMTMDEVILALQEGRLAEIDVTIPEGWRAEQIAASLEEQELFAAADYLAVVRDPGRFDHDFLDDLPAGATLEGFLFPDTYRVARDQVTPEAFVRMQLDTFGRRVTPELREAARTRGMTLLQAVTLASIVEREAVVSEERPIIASVFINRWEDGMRLEADPTVQYALGQQTNGDWWKRPLLLSDLEFESPYNTYRSPGLPPGPICNPGLDAVQATVGAPPSPYYYFVARGDGSGTHVFAATFEEHQQNVARERDGS